MTGDSVVLQLYRFWTPTVHIPVLHTDFSYWMICYSVFSIDHIFFLYSVLKMRLSCILILCKRQLHIGGFCMDLNLTVFTLFLGCVLKMTSENIIQYCFVWTQWQFLQHSQWLKYIICNSDSVCAIYIKVCCALYNTYSHILYKVLSYFSCLPIYQ